MRRRLPVVPERRVLERDAPHAALGQHPEQQPRGLGVARADDDPGRRRGGAAHAAEVARERLAQRQAAEAAAVVELGVGRLRGGARDGPAQARRGNSETSGVVAVKSKRTAARRGGSGRAGSPAGPAATTVPAPRRAASQPSAVSCSYASVTTPRETPSWAASAREAGSRTPCAGARRGSPRAARPRAGAAAARRGGVERDEQPGSSAPSPHHWPVGARVNGPGRRTTSATRLRGVSSPPLCAVRFAGQASGYRVPEATCEQRRDPPHPPGRPSWPRLPPVGPPFVILRLLALARPAAAASSCLRSATRGRPLRAQRRPRGERPRPAPRAPVADHGRAAPRARHGRARATSPTRPRRATGPARACGARRLRDGAERWRHRRGPAVVARRRADRGRGGAGLARQPRPSPHHPHRRPTATPAWARRRRARGRSGAPRRRSRSPSSSGAGAERRRPARAPALRVRCGVRARR